MPYTPFTVDATNWAQSFTANQDFTGPLKVGSKLYTWGSSFDTSNPPALSVVWKSTDNGATWTAITDNRGPAAAIPGYDPVGNRLVWAMTGTGGAAFLFDFDFSGPNVDTFGASYAAAGPIMNGGATRILSNGNIRIIDTAGTTLQWAEFASGAWSVPATFATDAAGVTAMAILDPSDGIALFWRRPGGPPNGYVKSGLLDVAGTLGTVTTYPQTADVFPFNFGYGTTDGTDLSVPFEVQNNPTGFLGIRREIGSPFTGPVWTEDTVDATVNGGSEFITVESGLLTCYFTENVDATRIRRCQFVAGAWNAGTVIYDIVAVPPPGLVFPSNPPLIDGLSASTDGLIIQVADATAPAHHFGSTLVFLQPPGVPLLVTCPPNTATAGVAYLGFLFVTGGLAPYIFSVTVGALPPGLVLDPNTGQVSGFPTVAGVYAYTIFAVDSLGSTGSSSCSITVHIGFNCMAQTSGIQGVPFSSSIQTVGAVGAQTFVLAAGSLPPGLHLNPHTGEISGTPSGPGTFTFTITVTDSADNTGSGTCSITVLPNAQLIFHGVRRVPGPPRHLIKEYPYKPKAMTYVVPFTISTVNPWPGYIGVNPQIVEQEILDYDFDLMDLKITYSNDPAGGPVPPVVCEIQMYDAVKQKLSNLPVLDVFYNGAPRSEYEMGAFVPTIEFPIKTLIRCEIWSLVVDPTALPISGKLHWTGVNRVPC